MSIKLKNFLISKNHTRLKHSITPSLFYKFNKSSKSASSNKTLGFLAILA